MHSGEIILHVNSNIRARALLGAILEQNGFLVLPASNSEEAVRCCQEIHFDVALLSYPVSGASGSTLPAEIKLLRPDVPIIMISGRVAISEQELAFVNAHFGAGTSLDDLVTTMHRLVSHAYLQRSERPAPRAWADAT